MRKFAMTVTALAVVASVVGVVDTATADQTAHRGAGERPPVAVSDPDAACAALAGVEIDAAQIALPTRGGIVDSAELRAASGDEPEFCLVRGHIDSYDPEGLPINFQLNLPSTWVRRSVQFGGGGFNGSVVTGLGNLPGTTGGGPATPLERNYATFGSDAGTDTGGFPDGSFGLNAEAFANYSGESVKRTRDAAQFLIAAYYGQSPKHQYYVGGSKGGHEGLVAAQRYGDDYDGIIAYYPAKQNLWLIYGWDNLVRLNARDPLSGAQQALVLDAAIAACDGLDGLEDGVIADRDGCDRTFDVTTLECPGGGNTGDDCLSAIQIDTLLQAAAPVGLPYPETNGGTTTGPFPVFHGGSLVGTLGAYNYFNSGVMRYWYLKDPAASPADFDWIDDRAAVEEVTHQYDATDPDIGRFLSGGGKLILVQGTTDMLVAPAATDPYYEALVDRYGGRIRNTVRYYVQPGYGHGGGDFGLSYDSLTALDGWVTKGAAPANQIAYDGNPGADRSMPLCEYPAWPQYSGTGDPSVASSFTCVEG